MRFTGIEKIDRINEEEGLMDLEIGVELDATIDSRWELVDPKVWVACRDKGELELESIELTDQGMVVHGFEFNERDRTEILRLISERAGQKKKLQ